MSTEAHPEHAIRCPWCLAPAGQRCTTRRGRHLSVASHQTRIDAWAEPQAKDNADTA